MIIGTVIIFGLLKFSQSCYNRFVHKAFYASGFLYHQDSQQILLHQSDSKNKSSDLWGMIGGASRQGETVQKTFQRIIHEWLNIKLDPNKIFPVYDYFHKTLHKTHHVFYAEIGKHHSLPKFSKNTLSWFTFKQTTKLPFSLETKQDVIVSQRVIMAQERTDNPVPIQTP